MFGACEFASVSSVHSWTGDPGVTLLQRTPATFSVPVGSLSSSLHARRGDGAGESSGHFFPLFSVASPASSLHAQQGGEAGEASEYRSSRVPPWPPDLRVGRLGGYLSPLLVEWLLCAVLLLTLLLRLPCSVQRLRRFGCGSSRWLFSLVRSQCDFCRSTNC